MHGLTVDLSALRKPVRTIETQLRQYHVTKVGGARHIGEPHDHKSGGGLEPLGPIGVYAYVQVASEKQTWKT